MRHFRTAALLLLSLAATACAPDYARLRPEDPVPVAVLDPAPGPARAERVVIVSIDGLRPDAIEKAGAANLQKLISRGVYCPKAETIRPSITLPSHTSMLTGLDFRRHGVVWNNFRPGHLTHPSVFTVAAQAKKASAMLFSKDKFHFLAHPKAVAWIYGPGAPFPLPEREDVTDSAQIEKMRLRDEAEDKRKPSPAPAPARPAALKPGDLLSTADMLARAFKEVWTLTKTPLVFVHFREPDSAGHRYGWMGTEYLEAVRKADQAVGELVAAIEGHGGFAKSALILSSDHGGSGKGHYRVMDPERIENIQIPWICVGPKVPAGIVLDRVVRTYDTAPTALAFLGLGAPAGIDGRAVAEVLK
jgi:predicted AlkP superfamily pyrophosphatase or phosphodiesterase